MKKLRLFGMFALTFALVFGAASCKQDAGPSGDNVADVLKDGEDLSGTWKITDGSVYLYSKTNGAEVKYEYDSIAEIVDYMDLKTHLLHSQKMKLKNSLEKQLLTLNTIMK